MRFEPFRFHHLSTRFPPDRPRGEQNRQGLWFFAPDKGPRGGFQSGLPKRTRSCPPRPLRPLRPPHHWGPAGDHHCAPKLQVVPDKGTISSFIFPSPPSPHPLQEAIVVGSHGWLDRIFGGTGAILSLQSPSYSSIHLKFLSISSQLSIIPILPRAGFRG